jgi:hypothetical protein
MIIAYMKRMIDLKYIFVNSNLCFYDDYFISRMDILKTHKMRHAFKTEAAKGRGGKWQKRKEGRRGTEPYLESSGSQQDWK